MIRQKWHHVKRNVRIDDIVLLQTSSALRGEWRIGRVAVVFPDKEGIVRNVCVMIKSKPDGSKNYQPLPPIYINRHVSKVLVLVPVDDDSDEELAGKVEDTDGVIGLDDVFYDAGEVTERNRQNKKAMDELIASMEEDQDQD